MERFVAILVPHGWLDMAGRMSLVMIVIATWAFFSHYVVFQAYYPTKAHYLAHILLVSFPPLLVTFRLLVYLNVLQQRLERLAATDVLTGLANRRAFFERAGAEQRRRGGVAMVLDVDHFKHINDTYGHNVGDRCLVALSDLMRAETRDTDIVGRLGGEEFAVFLVDAPLDKAREMGERFADGVQFSIGDDADDVRITASVGAAGMCDEADIHTMISRADSMMYEAKRAGRAQLLIWEAPGETSGVPQDDGAAA